MEIKINKELKLRTPKPSDREDVFAFASDPEVTKFLSYPTHKNLEDADYVINKIWLSSKNNFEKLVLEFKGKVIGTCNISFKDGVNQIGYQLNKNYWRQGIISKVLPKLIDSFFEKNEKKKIYVVAEKENIKSWNLINKFSFIKSKQIDPRTKMNFYYHSLDSWKKRIKKTHN